MSLGRLVAVAFSLALLASACRGPAGLVDGSLAPCPGSPNCVNSEDGPGQSAIAPLAFDGEATPAFHSLVAFLEEQPRVELVLQERDYAQFLFVSRILRFADDVELRLDRDAGVIHIRSASRFGFSDLGVNRERVEWIRENWEGTP